MGESGAGKSTIINSVMGLVTPEMGNIKVDGIIMNHSSIQNIRNKIAWVPQEINLPYEFVKETIDAPYSLKINHSLKKDLNQMYLLFESLGLDKGIYHKRMREISGGERQRLMICLAVLLNKKILLLDEPTSAVDSITREKMIDFLRSLDVTLLAVTHDDVFASSCDRIIRINKIVY